HHPGRHSFPTRRSSDLQGAEDDALSGVGLRIEPATLVAVVGENGSGKSTLARVLAGRAVASGRVLRPGAAALGQAGGTAMVFQRDRKSTHLNSSHQIIS